MKFRIGILAVMILAGCGKKESGSAKNDAAPPPPPPPPEVAKPEKPSDLPRTENPVRPPQGDPRNSSSRNNRSAIGSAYQAGKRLEQASDLKSLGTMMEQYYLEFNRMPNKQETLDYIRRDFAKMAKLIDDGIVILTETKNHDALWAYEVDADNQGGVVLIKGTPERKIDPTEVRKLIDAAKK